MKNLIFLVCSILLFIGCSKEETTDQIAYEIIDESTLSYDEENKIPKQFLVIENENDWNDFIPEIERVNPNQAEKLKNLNFDFTSNDLIIVIGEFFNYCCSKIKINKVYKKDGKTMVDFEESGPGMATALSQAYLILEVQKNF
ncbi:hypothetical protein BC962_3287 [Gillisia mitskevichiae]|uniref:Lipoprotein n=1 Tax=Gillisia mitskevichiae TaxID=270921 RepID=A0A495NZB1_9FLAO|nr:hypothetical protein [Gillisia mitskevichiae]RKS42498.1 hypothetical protein BC962_3287 [Gillisia mitskevichiae]